ncbi:MAG: STAS domain-containing protein [Planctomycetota bacterium]|nr:STAS domain-containing protein [Planctomycetota bacterium]
MSPNDVPVLTPPAEITERSVEELRSVLQPHMEGEGPGVVLDLEEVTFINSSGLGTLVQVGMRLDGAGRRLAFARPNKTIERMLKLVGLDSKMPMFRSVEEARGSIGPSAASRG